MQLLRERSLLYVLSLDSRLESHVTRNLDNDLLKSIAHNIPDVSMSSAQSQFGNSNDSLADCSMRSLVKEFRGFNIVSQSSSETRKINVA